MDQPSTSDHLRSAPYGDLQSPKRTASAVSWGAIIAGAIAAAALSVILLMLGVGLGLSSVSPWAGEGVSATTFGISSILWLTLTQLLASGMGGYLAGRLRARWAFAASDEVYFRDTAHGFLAWAVASLATAALLSSAVTGIVGGAAKAGATAATAAAGAAATQAGMGAPRAGGARAAGEGMGGDQGSNQGGDSLAYDIDALFRATPSASAATPAESQPGTAAVPATAMAPGAPQPPQGMAPGASTAEAGRIFAHSLRAGALSPEDARYVAHLVAQRTGMSPADADRRVKEGYARLSDRLRQAEDSAKEAANKARKATAYATLWAFISLLIGAFIASLCATYGGRQRDATPLPL